MQLGCLEPTSGHFGASGINAPTEASSSDCFAERPVNCRELRYTHSLHIDNELRPHCDRHRRLNSAQNTAIMPVPFEALIPYGIILAMFGVTGAGMSKIKNMQNGGKRARRSIDQWDRQMMDRDRRLTGFLRGQSDAAIAPAGFELNNPWRVEKRIS